MFQFQTPTTVKLVHLNVRTEKHGDESVAAVDLKFDRTTGNDCLDTYCPGLLDALYHRAQPTEDQGEIDGVPKIKPNLRFPAMKAPAFDLEAEGYTLRMSYGIGGDSDLIFGGCKLNKHSVDLAEGGSVTQHFRVQTCDIPDGALDKLSKLLEGKTQITLIPPEDKPKQEPIDGTVGHPGVASLEKARNGKAKPEKEAGDIFAKTHGAAEAAGA